MVANRFCSNVIDVFTIQPQRSGTVTPGAESKEALQKMFGDLTPEELQLRTIKKGRGRPLFTTVGKSGEGWKAAQDAIG